MGMSTHIVGFKAPDDKWKKMKAVWDACEAAGTTIPNKVLEFFDHTEPDSSGVTINLDGEDEVEEWGDLSRTGFQVDIKGLLKKYPDLTHIRFYNAY